MIVKIKYGAPFALSRGEMSINLQQMCELEGKKCIDFGSTQAREILCYPLSKVRKVLKLIYQHCSDDEIVRVQLYLSEHSKKYHSEFIKIIAKCGGRM